MISFQRYKVCLLVMVIGLLAGCQTTKYIPDGEYLLAKVSVDAGNDEIPDKVFEEYVRQKPNKKIFGFARFHMGLYNLSNPDKNNWLHNWFRKIGEEPVLYQPELNKLTRDQLQTFLVNKGYHDGQISDTVEFRHNKAYLKYNINSGLPHILTEIDWSNDTLIPDDNIRRILAEDSAGRLIKEGDRVDLDKLRLERERITKNLNDNGLYGFIKEYVYYVGDTIPGLYQTRLKVGVNNPVLSGMEEGNLNYHPIYKIRDIRIIGDFAPRAYMKDPTNYFSGSDTIRYKDVEFIFNDKLPVRKNLLHSCLYFKSGDLYNQSMVDKSYKAFLGLRNFKTTNIRFTPEDFDINDTIVPLDCQIELSPSLRQRYEVAAEVTHSSGNLGMAGNLSYRHRNLFHGAEDFELKFKGAMEYLANSTSDFNRMIEFGVDARLDVPQFWLPVKAEKLQQRYSPRTEMNFSFNYQQRPDFTRTIGNASFGYNWKSVATMAHQINVIDLNYINVSNMSEDFSNFIKGKYIESSYKSHVVPAINYSFTFSNQSLNKDKDFYFIRFRPELAGNLFSAGYMLSGAKRPDQGFSFFDIPYAQYAMADIDLRYFKFLNESNGFAFRIFAGAGYPYGNAEALPFEKKYFSGGSNGIRAWQVRSLGPGTYVLPEELKNNYPNQLGDIKLEGNAEYRFDLFWQLEGAVFLDAGNIWSITAEDEREGALFKPASFYKDIAVGTGMGLRLDLSFVIIRLDLGAKLRDPGYFSGPTWFPKYDSYFRDGLVLNFAIGYSF